MSQPDEPEATPVVDAEPVEATGKAEDPVQAVDTEEPKKRGLMPLWAVALTAVLIVAGSFVLFRYVFNGSSSEACASVTGVGDAAKVEFVDCDDDNATFQVATRKPANTPGCPEGAYREIPRPDELLCLVPNFVAGNCYVPDDPNQAFRVGRCEDALAIRIVKVVEGTSDASAVCPEGNGLGYPEPPTAVCVSTPIAGR
ncbi:hypothetical protein V5P93_000574 [Actinokineospora auranticolor]|uniref:Uncharacterized protein n=1 Tax=Actinokineospora auranticolor TaxID=155976 RepID=A0A2S6GZF0_9PSEU|nr:hypothetical protein [Actinokineospora auranticolor]PPK70546.1 hypothetical protein CLV40_102461 [Actinokineospora auranticolor]